MRLLPPSQRGPGAQTSDWPLGASDALPPSLTGPPKAAAVLVPLMRLRDEWHVMYIRRASNDRDHHSGQVAFPGGRVEACDQTLEQTALREAHEEVGLPPASVEVLGRIQPYLTITNYLVTPVVGITRWPEQLSLQPEEVSRVFSIPLDWLATPGNHSHREREPAIAGRSVSVVYFRHYDGELLWGATARMTLTLLASLHWDAGARADPDA